MSWFVDKLGPAPQAAPRKIGANEPRLQQTPLPRPQPQVVNPTQQAAPQRQNAAAPPPPAPEPEEKKKKKGWF